MGTRFNIVFPNTDEDICARWFNLIKSECERIEFILSYFNPASDVAKINENAGKTFVVMNDELFSIIKTCLEYSEMTFGAFDITLRPVIEHLKNDLSSISEENIISDMAQIELDEEKKTIHFKNDKMKIDFGGFGKGYALEKINSILENSSIKNVFISFGESSILAKGKRPDGDEWLVGIKDLYNSENSLHTFSLSNSSISTSSNYYVDDNGQLCNKINVINPFTKKPVEDLAIASVKSDSPLQAEILSTAFLVMDDEKIKETLKQISNVEAVKIKFIEKEPLINIYK